jgi:hypothetical protein
MKTLLLSVLIALLTLVFPAQAAFKCKEDGKTVYQDAPCEGEGHKVDTSSRIDYKPNSGPRQRSRSTSTTTQSIPPKNAGGDKPTTAAHAKTAPEESSAPKR